MRVIDETYNALFLVWDTEGAIIFGKSALKLKQEDVSYCIKTCFVIV